MNSKELLAKLEIAIKLLPRDLMLPEFDRGFKMGQLELLEKIRILLKEGGK